MQKSVGLSTTDQVFEYTFTMSKDPTASDRIVFDAGMATAGWAIDNISLSEYVVLDSIVTAVQPRPIVTPGVARDQRVTVIQYDHSGRVVSRASGAGSTVLRQRESMPPGCYITVIDMNGKKQVRKTAVVGR
jgi:hypothetical protein